MTDDVTRLPDDFIGKQDERKLESFGAYLLEHGRATRWRWSRQRGIDVAFEINRRSAPQPSDFAIRRDNERDTYCLTDRSHRLIEAGTLEHIMTVADRLLVRSADQAD